MSYQSDLGKVKGLGSAKHGFGHWWMQRITAVLLIPCGLFVLFGLNGIDQMSAASAAAWLAQPLNAGITLLFSLAASYHAALGIQVVVEDYVHGHAMNLTLRFITKLLMIAMMMTSIYAIATLLFG